MCFILLPTIPNGKYLGQKIFKLDPAAKVPSSELRDDVDYVPTSEINFPTGHPQFWDLINLNSPVIRKTLSQHDAILAVGCNMFNQFLYMPQILTGKCTVIHLDVSAWEIEKNYSVEVGLWGDIKTGLEDLYEALGQLMSGAKSS